MKIAFCNRPNWDSPLGGDGVQMLKTKAHLEELYGLNIDIVTDPNLLNESYDVVHIFNFVTYNVTETFFNKANALSLPIVSSCIFWDYTYAQGFTRLFCFTHLSNIAAKFIKMLVGVTVATVGYPDVFTKKVRNKYSFFCASSKYVLPNSIEEGRLLQEYIRKPDIMGKIHVVFNGTDNNLNPIMNEVDFFNKYKIPHDYILQVGRIESVKNQMNVLYSLRKDKDIPIVFIGKIAEPTYYKKLKRLADKRGNVFFIDAVPHEDIDSFYNYARLHVLISLRESPGLVSLEALMNDCPIVISSERYTPVKTYFSNQPYIVDPFDIEQIRYTLLKAYKEHNVVKEGMESFTWEKAAEQTYDAYKKCLAQKI